MAAVFARRFTVVMLALVGTIMMVLTGMPAAAAASSPHTYRVQGTQTALGPVTFEMHSNPGRSGLHGLWTTTSVPHQKVVPPYYFSTGTEQFDGCLDTNGSDTCDRGEPKGQMFFDFVFWARFDKSGAEVEGGCVHPITGGSGDFEHATGLLTMRDFLVGTALRTTYRGTVTVHASGAKVASPAVSAGSPVVANATVESHAAHPSAC